MSAKLSGALATIAALALSGCVSFGAEPPESLLTLTSSLTAPAGEQIAGEGAPSVRVFEPDTSARLAVPRVPVQVNATEIAYLKEAFWVEKPARLFRNLLAETMRARGGWLVLDVEDPGIGADTSLHGTLRDFGYDAQTSSVIVRYDAMWKDADGAVKTRRFEAIESGVIAEGAPVGAALNRAANDVAGQVADWIAGG